MTFVFHFHWFDELHLQSHQELKVLFHKKIFNEINGCNLISRFAQKKINFEILFIPKITELLTVAEEVVVALMTSEIEFET